MWSTGFAIHGRNHYLNGMRTAFEPCLPTSGKAVPATPDWFHEIKYDGYRLIVQRDGARVRVFSRNGNPCDLGGRTRKSREILKWNTLRTRDGAVTINWDDPAARADLIETCRRGGI